MENKNYVSLQIVMTEELTPDKISDVLGIRCDIGWIKGQKIITPKGEWYGKYYSFSSWIYESKLPTNLDVDELLDDLLNIFYPLKEKITRLSGVKLSFSADVYFYTNTPPLSFSTDIIKKISELEASLDIDLYDMKT